MSSPQSARRPGAVVVVQSLLWLWLVFPQRLAVLGYQASATRADQSGWIPACNAWKCGQLAWPRRSRPSSSARPSRRTLTSKTPARSLEARAARVEISVAAQAATTSERFARRSEADQGAPSRRTLPPTQQRTSRVRRLKTELSPLSFPRRRRQLPPASAA